jgi:hypothetical protein
MFTSPRLPLTRSGLVMLLGGHAAGGALILIAMWLIGRIRLNTHPDR